MKLSLLSSISIFTVVLFSSCTQDQDAIQITLPELKDQVEVIRDSFGINHIYAQNQHDLFYTQGYMAARDRIFQFEIWRRQATGTVAEILGPRELKRDIGTRLFQFRGDMQEEMAHYHPDGVEIIKAYTAGVNAYIAEVRADPEKLPVTMKALGLLPEMWTPDVVISRHQGLLGNIERELAIGRAVENHGVEKVKEYMWFHPGTPDLTLDPVVDGHLASENILGLYEAFRQSVKFKPEDVLPEYRSEETIGMLIPAGDDEEEQAFAGSNNWVIGPQKTAGGKIFMANDPHRTLAVPSLRYWVHLHAPGWNVIGGGEPEIPGVSIGHNGYGAWGLTVFRTDGEDLYVYDLNPNDLTQYRYMDGWESMRTIHDTIPVKGQDRVPVELRYTRHGPVTWIDTASRKAYAVRCAWMEPGGSPYLASLRMNQARSWEEFRAACNYSNIPGENMIWADEDGNLGWQAVGIVPVRPNFSGQVPVAGDGRYEWDGYLPIIEKPHLSNPESQYFATANENVTPESYEPMNIIEYVWSDPFRGDRIRSVLDDASDLTMEDMIALQTDYYSMPASILVPMIEELETSDAEIQNAIEQLGSWDYYLDSDSPQAALYVTWETILRREYFSYFPDSEMGEYTGPGIQLSRIIEWLRDPEGKVYKDRAAYLLGTLSSAITSIEARQGSDPSQWEYGHPSYKHVQINHALSDAVRQDISTQLNTPLAPRGGNQYTPGSTGSNMNQSSGATFKIIVDVGDWDNSVGMNSPGQSGDPASPFYMNLFEAWAKDRYFPVYYSREKVEGAAYETVRINSE